MDIVSQHSLGIFLIFAIAFVISLGYRFRRRESGHHRNELTSEAAKPHSTVNFWRTWKGWLVQACFLGGLVVLLFFEEPVLNYRWSNLVTCFAVTVALTFLAIRYQKRWERLAGIKPKRSLLQALIMFGFTFIMAGWPFLRVVSIVASGLRGTESARAMVLYSYERVGRGGASCGDNIRLQEINGGEKYVVCADLINIKGFSNSELQGILYHHPSGVPVQVQMKESIGVVLVQQVTRS
ncbi:MAG: hypothetical protein ACYC9J_11815 [Sulfuricaulis sp.]